MSMSIPKIDRVNIIAKIEESKQHGTLEIREVKRGEANLIRFGLWIVRMGADFSLLLYWRNQRYCQMNRFKYC
jgi:hypothetical protein